MSRSLRTRLRDLGRLRAGTPNEPIARVRAWRSWSAVALVLGGCAIPGDRAATGACPVGESCAPQTPNGLYFRGEDIFGDLGTTAVGGVQVVSVLADQNEIFTLPFDAASDGPSFRVLSVEPPNVTIEGLAPGTSKLRILQRNTGLLFDRVNVKVAALAWVSIGPPLLSDVDSTAPWAVAAGAEVPLELSLFAADATPLVDDTAVTISATPLSDRTSVVDVAVASSFSWSSFTVRARAAGNFALTIDTAGTSFEQSLLAVDRVTDIALQPATLLTLVVGQPGTVCFTGLDDGTQVSGLPWTYSTTSAGVDLFADGNCVTVTASSQGSVNVAAAAFGFSKSFAFSVVASKTGSMSSPLVAPRGPTPGDRARR